MRILSLVLALTAVLTSSIHLTALVYRNDRAARITKPLLIPPIYGSVLCLTGFDVPYLGLVAATAVLYTLGDILLDRKGSLMFVLGSASFILGHLCLSARNVLCSPSLWLIAGLVIAAIPYALFLHRLRGKENYWQYILYGGAVYVLAATSFAAFPSLSSSAAIAGAALYGYSDSRIMFRMAKVRKTPGYIVMATYIAANVFLAISLIPR